MSPGRPAVLLASLAAMLAPAGCGDDADAGGAATGAGKPELTVSAAASLKAAFTRYGERFPDASVRFSFAGSDELAAQISRGARPDVYAAASMRLPEELHADGLADEPAAFARNRLVLAVPARDAEVASLEDLEGEGVTIAIGDADVPVGAYTREVLDRLPRRRRRAILEGVRSEEPDVAGITGKLTQGAVDAGFVYVTDVRATGGELRAIELPADLRPAVTYGVAVVRGTRRRAEARAFVAGLLDGAGARELDAAGFEPPPGR